MFPLELQTTAACTHDGRAWAWACDPCSADRALSELRLGALSLHFLPLLEHSLGLQGLGVAWLTVARDVSGLGTKELFFCVSLPSRHVCTHFAAVS